MEYAGPLNHRLSFVRMKDFFHEKGLRSPGTQFPLPAKHAKALEQAGIVLADFNNPDLLQAKLAARSPAGPEQTA